LKGDSLDVAGVKIDRAMVETIVHIAKVMFGFFV